MNMSPRIWIALASAVVIAAVPFGKAAGQCEVCPTTPVVAYQPVVTPVDPGLINGWYPGKLLDRWAASRAAYRSTAMTAATTAYRPLIGSAPVTSYRPVSSLFSTSHMPVSTYRPVLTQPLIATTAYSPITTATTAYSPIVTSTTACCDPCSTGSVVNYAAPAAPCCGVPSSSAGTSYGGMVTEQPALQQDVQIPGSAKYPPRPPANNNSGTSGEQSVLPNEQNGTTNESQAPQQSGPQSTGAGFEAPQLYVPGLPPENAEESLDRTARGAQTDAVPAVYSTPVRPQLTHDSRPAPPTWKALPSRAERDAGWVAVSK